MFKNRITQLNKEYCNYCKLKWFNKCGRAWTIYKTLFTQPWSLRVIEIFAAFARLVHMQPSFWWGKKTFKLKMLFCGSVRSGGSELFRKDDRQDDMSAAVHLRSQQWSCFYHVYKCQSCFIPFYFLSNFDHVLKWLKKKKVSKMFVAASHVGKAPFLYDI